MWRSVVAARASLLRQGTRSLVVTRCSDVSLSESISHLQHSSTSIVVPRSYFFRSPRFFSEHSSSYSDSETLAEDYKSISAETVEFSDNDDTKNEGCVANDEIHEFCGEFVGVEENSDPLEETVAVSDGNVEEGKIYEVNVEQLESVLSLLRSTIDGSFESSLDKMGLALHEDFVLKVLKTPHILGENLMRFLRWALKSQPECKVTTHVVDALVQSVCSNPQLKDVYSLWDWIKEIGEKENGLLNAEILNQLITVFSKFREGKAAFGVLDNFEVLGYVPNAESYYFTVEALCRSSLFDLAWQVLEKMLRDVGTLPESDRVGKVIEWFCKGKKAKDVHSVYLLAKEKRINLSRACVNFLISCLCRNNETIELALEMLNDFSLDERKRAIKPYMAVIHSLCRAKNTSKAKTLLLKMIAEGPPPGNAAFNFVINGCSKAGDLGDAKELIKLMESRGLKPDVFGYTVVISGYANAGQMKEAYEVLDEAKKRHTKLSPVTYHTLISAHCKREELDAALKLLGEMKEFGVKPSAVEYNKLIKSLCVKALDWRRAERLFEEMKANGFHHNDLFQALIRAVRELEEEELRTEELNIEA